MQIFVNGQGINLSQRDFVSKGGEGSVYKRGKVAYKIYEKLDKVIPLAKIGELSSLNRSTIVCPQNPIYDSGKHLCGFTMDWLGGNNTALCKLFTNNFRDSNGITNEMIIELVENIKNDTHYIHQNKCLIVDGNELNYMVAPDFMTPYFIDVNSWQTPSFPATAIMPSIRDWTSDKFTEMTDWFSFAIVTFQLFVGIHPFKGTYKKYKANDFRQRVIDGVSVFNTSVLLPPSVRDFNLIPSSYKDWYYRMFEHGNRVPPPNLPGQVGQIQVHIQVIQSTDNFEITTLREFTEQILFHNSQFNVNKTKDHLYIQKTDYKISPDVEVIFTPLEQIPILVKIENNKVKFKALNHSDPVLDLDATDKMIINNILFLRNKDKLMEMDFKYLGGKIHPFIKTTWGIEYNSSKLFSNIVHQNVLGKCVLSIPLPTYNKSQFITKMIPELDDYRIIDAKYENKVCVLIAHKGNSYSRIVLVFDDKHEKYTCRIINGVDYNSINFTTLDNGVCVMITEDDAMEIFLNRIDKPNIKRIEDPIINSSMRLCKSGTELRFFRENKLYKMKMK